MLCLTIALVIVIFSTLTTGGLAWGYVAVAVAIVLAGLATSELTLDLEGSLIDGTFIFRSHP